MYIIHVPTFPTATLDRIFIMPEAAQIIPTSGLLEVGLINADQKTNGLRILDVASSKRKVNAPLRNHFTGSVINTVAYTNGELYTKRSL